MNINLKISKLNWKMNLSKILNAGKKVDRFLDRAVPAAIGIYALFLLFGYCKNRYLFSEDMTEYYKRGGVTVLFSDSCSEEKKIADMAKLQPALDKLSSLGKLDSCDYKIYLCNSNNEYQKKRDLRTADEIEPDFLIEYVTEKRDTSRAYPEMDNVDKRDYFVAVITYSYIREKLGFWKWKKTITYEPWKIKGYSAYTAGYSVANPEISKKLFLERKISDGNITVLQGLWKNIYGMFRYRLRTDYLLRYKGIPEDEYWETEYDTDKLDDEIREALQSGEYRAFEQ